VKKSPHPFFTVIVPVYNQAQFLGTALDSLIAQTDTDWEAIVVNDGSTDDTPRVLEEYERRDVRFRCFHKKNGGVASALNLGIREARGEWVCWLSSDDMFMPCKLEIHREWMRHYPEDKFFFTYFRLLRESTGEITDHDLWGPLPEREFQLTGLFYRNYISGITICIHRETWLRIGMFDEGLHYGQDYDMWLRLLVEHPGRFIPEWTVISRNHALQGSEVFPQACYYDTAKAIIRFLNAHRFEELFPLLDLNDTESAFQAVQKTLDVLTEPSGFLYSLGPHPVLLLRLLEWVGSSGLHANPALGGKLKEIISNRMFDFANRRNFSLLAKSVFTAMRNPAFSMQYVPLPPSLVGEHYYYSHDIAASEILPLRQYLSAYENLQVFERSEEEAAHELVVLLPHEIELPGTLETADRLADILKFFSRKGYAVLLVGYSKQSLGIWNGFLFVGADDAPSLKKLLSELGGVEVLLSFAGPQALKWCTASRKVNYALSAVNAEDVPFLLHEMIKNAPVQVDFLEIISGFFRLGRRAISKRVSRLARMFIP
jgi:glycosyltransferase involved in cell wall biosynthesis